MSKKIMIEEITDEQKLEAADLESKLRALDEYIRKAEEKLSEMQMEVEEKISAARIKQAEIKKQLGNIRKVSET